ncbi:Protein STRUBBELIG-RECEPTOR FAMILY [Arachis hypogaea]|nr:Protein STRUBBELIG-RECEPTOR FAMILY [Arachis hypogaea]
MLLLQRLEALWARTRWRWLSRSGKRASRSLWKLRLKLRLKLSDLMELILMSFRVIAVRICSYLFFFSSGLKFRSFNEGTVYVCKETRAILWQINDLPPSKVEKELESELIKAIKDKSVGLLRSGLLKPCISDPSYTHFYEEIERLGNKKCKRRVLASSHQFHLANYFLEDMDDAHSTLNFIEEGNQIRTEKSCGKCKVGFKNPMKEARNGISTFFGGSSDRSYLSSNNIGGSTPSNLPVTLRNFFFSVNQFTGRISASLSSLTGLTDMDVSNNQFAGPIPSKLLSIPNFR